MSSQDYRACPICRCWPMRKTSPVEDHEQQLRDTAALLEKTFADFNLSIKVVGIHTGPVITQYEIALETGPSTQQSDESLRRSWPSTSASPRCGSSPHCRAATPSASKCRTNIGKPSRLKELILGTGFPCRQIEAADLPWARTSKGQPLVYDMTTMPHLLIAGRTGTGKSVCLNSIIVSMLLTRTPDECRMIMIDPKKG